ncbi:FtsX-like permease family protein, partial [Streptomyces corynorhini]
SSSTTSSSSEREKPVTLIGVEPDSYTRLARLHDLGAFPARVLKARNGDGVLDAVASPATAERLGTAPRRIASAAGEITVRITTVRSHTPAAPHAEFLLVNGAGLAAAEPTALLVAGDDLDARKLSVAARGTSDPKRRLGDLAPRASLLSEERASFTASPLQSGAERIYAVAVVAGAFYAVVALLLSFLYSTRERTALLVRLRTMGLTHRQGCLLLGLEALPPALLAAGGGILVGWATIRLLAPGIDLVQLAVASAAEPLTGGVSLSTDVWSLVLPAAGVLVLAGAVAAAQAWWSGRRGTITELRAGDSR